MVHIDNNKFNILTVYSLHVVPGQLQGDYTTLYDQLYTKSLLTWENIIKVATEVILIILQTKKPFTNGAFDGAREKC